jgi:MoaA/NifB/PqqE/SkfB family radical SAM enzyme
MNPIGFLAAGIRNELAVSSDFYLKTHFSRPYIAIIEPTLRCPMACKFCDLPTDTTFPESKELSAATWVRILRDLTEFNPLIRDIYIAGGEPFFRRDLCDILEGAHHLGLRTRLLTIGALCTQKVLDRLLRSPLHWLKFSILSAREQVHDGFVGRPAFGAVVRAVRYLHDHGYPGKMGFLSTVWNGNVRELEEIVKLAEDLRIEGVLFRPLFGQTQSMREFQNPPPLSPLCRIHDPAELRRAIARLKELKLAGAPILNSNEQLDVLVRQNLGTNDGLPGCHLMYESIYIRPNGDIEVCGHMSLGTMGNCANRNVADVLGSKAAWEARHCVSRHCKCQGNIFVRKSFGEKAGLALDVLRTIGAGRQQ